MTSSSADSRCSAAYSCARRLVAPRSIASQSGEIVQISQPLQLGAFFCHNLPVRFPIPKPNLQFYSGLGLPPARQHPMHPYAAHMPARAAYAAWGGEPSMAPSSYVPSSDVKRARPQSFCGVPPSGWAGSSGSVAWGASTATKPVVPAWAGPSTAAAPSGMTSPRRSLMQRPYSAASSSSTSSDNPDRVIVQVTRDNEHFSVVNVTGLDTAPAIRECILRKLQLPPDFSCWGFWRTEIGADVVQSPLIDDDTLLALCLQLGDDRGTVKFYVAPMEHRATFSGEPRYALRATSSPEMHRPASGTLVHLCLIHI